MNNDKEFSQYSKFLPSNNNSSNNNIETTKIIGKICYWTAVSIKELIVNREFEIIERIIKYKNSFFDTTCTDLATSLGYLDLLKLFNQHRKPLFYYKIVEIASSKGYLNILTYFRAQRPDIKVSSDASIQAAEAGHLEVIKYLNENDMAHFNSSVMDKAAEKGHLDILVYLRKYRTEGCTSRAVTLACLNGHLKVLEYLHNEQLAIVTVNALVNSSEGGHVDCIDFLLRNKYFLPSHWVAAILDIAILRNHIPIIEYILKIQFPKNVYPIFTLEGIIHAAENGNTTILDLIHKNISLAYPGGILYSDFDKHLREVQVAAFNKASMMGQYIVLDYFIHNIFKGDTLVLLNSHYFFSALPKSPLSCIRFYVEIVNISPTYSPAFDSVYLNPECFEILKYLHNNGYQYLIKSSQFRLATGTSLEVVQFLNENYTIPPHPDLYTLAIQNQKFDILNYLNLHFPVKLSHLHLIKPIEYNDFKMLHLLESIIEDNTPENTPVQWKNYYDTNSLNEACKLGHIRMTEYILGKDPDIPISDLLIESSISSGSFTQVENLIGKWFQWQPAINIKNFSKFLSTYSKFLVLSSSQGFVNILHFLICKLESVVKEVGGNISIPYNEFFQNPLFCSILSRPSNPLPMFVYFHEVLRLKFQCQPNDTVLKNMIEKGYYEVFEYLIDNNLLYIKEYLETSIHYSIDENQKHITKLLSALLKDYTKGSKKYLKPVPNHTFFTYYTNYDSLL